MNMMYINDNPDNTDLTETVGPDIKSKYGTNELCFNPSPDGMFSWAFIDVGKTSLTLPVSIIDGEVAITLKVSSCPATFERNARAVITCLSKDELASLRDESTTQNCSEGFVVSPGCTNEYNSLEVVNCKSEIESENIFNIKLSDLPKVTNILQRNGIYFDARLLAHLINIQDKIPSNIGSSSSESNYSLDDILEKILNYGIDLPFVYGDTITPGKFLEYKEVTIDDKKVQYANRPTDVESYNLNGEIRKPGVGIALTFVKDADDKMYMVVNREYRPPIDSEYMATIRNGRPAYLVACPAGLVDSTDNNITITLKREIEEETGIQTQRSKELGCFISSAEGISETYGGGVCIGTIDTSNLKKLDNGDLRYTPSNTDGGVTQDVTLIQIEATDTASSLVSKFEKYGIPNSQSLALIYTLTNGNSNQLIKDAVTSIFPKENWIQIIEDFFSGK